MKKRMPDASPDEVEKAAAESPFEEVQLSVAFLFSSSFVVSFVVISKRNKDTQEQTRTTPDNSQQHRRHRHPLHPALGRAEHY